MVGALTLGPSSPRAGLSSFAAVVDAAAEAAGLGPPGRRVAEAIANVLLFVPLGAAAALLALRVRTWQVGIAAAAFSTAIELAQTLLPGRTSSLRDVGLNAAGGVLGHVVVRVGRYLWNRTTSTHKPPRAS
jgi:VanZ family protein